MLFLWTSSPPSCQHHHRDDLTGEVKLEQAWLLRQPFTWRRFGVTRSGAVRSERSDKSSDWLASANVVRDRKHSPSLSNNYPSLHAGCQLTNSSVIIPPLPVESGWQWAQYQSHSITLLLAFISPTLSFTMKDSGFLLPLMSLPVLLHTSHRVLWKKNTPVQPIKPCLINQWQTTE